jgi:hypothetical protein
LAGQTRRGAGRDHGAPDKSRTYNVRLIRRDYSYEVGELIALFGIHANTVSRWHADGLRPIDNHRPLLFHGSDLIDFLSRRQSARKRPCQPGEFFCCRCRGPRPAWENAIDIEIRDERRVVLKAVCEACGGAVNKIGTVRKISEYRTQFDVQTTMDLRLKG